jgi:hypothetical protein
MNEIGKENQNIFDSRRGIKNKVYHKIDDIKAFIYYGKRPFVSLFFSDFFISGEVIMLDENSILIRGKYDTKSYKIKDIIEIKISYLL